MDSLPILRMNSHDIWRMVSPLIYFHIDERHHPNRTIRQFGIRQDVPPDCNTEPLLHNIDLTLMIG